MGEIELTRKNVAQALADAQAKLVQDQGSLALQQRILAEAVDELQTANNDKQAKIVQCDEWRATWEKNKEKRTQEIEIVKQVENIIATKLDTMKDYLHGRADQD